MPRSLLALCAAVTGAGADTLGLPPCTHERVVPLAHLRGAPHVIVARDEREWLDTWRAVGGKGEAPVVDFERDMVVGVVSAPGEPRVVYRVQLDDAERPNELEVHVARPGGPCGFTQQMASAPLVVTPRSALPIHFVNDEMTDGMEYAADPTGAGVTRTDLGKVAGREVRSTARAATREAAEHAVVAMLTPAQRAKLAKGPLDRKLPHLPHAWTRLDVTREPDRWSIRYDDLAFTVNVATATVSPGTAP
jgi:hypothetical protein